MVAAGFHRHWWLNSGLTEGIFTGFKGYTEGVRSDYRRVHESLWVYYSIPIITRGNKAMIPPHPKWHPCVPNLLLP